MSNTTSSANEQAVVAVLQSVQLEIRVDYAVLALFVYEYVITLSAECQHIWKEKKSLVFYLFIGLRYSSLLMYTLEVFSDSLPIGHNKGCIVIGQAQSVTNLLCAICIGGLFILRAYALWDRNVWVLSTLGLVLLGRLITLSWTLFTSSHHTAISVSRRFMGCGTTPGPGLAIWSATSSALICTFDSLVLALTVAKTVQQIIRFRQANLGMGLSYSIFRDGWLSFLSIEFWIVASIAVTYLPMPLWPIFFTTVGQNVFSTILTQRLVLNLRQVDEQLRSVGPNISDLTFAHGSVIGNIGAPLRDTTDDELHLDQGECAHKDESASSRSEETETMEMRELSIEEISRSA